MKFIFGILTVKPCRSPLHLRVCGRSQPHSRLRDNVMFGHLHSVVSSPIGMDDTSTALRLFVIEGFFKNFALFLIVGTGICMVAGYIVVDDSISIEEAFEAVDKDVIDAGVLVDVVAFLYPSLIIADEAIV